ncbi:MAG: DUF2007 domain-containing protein [Pseudomonadota bacterium]
MQLIFSNQDIAAVGMIRSYLAGHGIKSVLRNEYSGSVMGEIAFFEVWPECWVDDQDAARAKALIEELDNRSSAPENDWQCTQCQEINPQTFDLCWNCQTPY